MKKYNFNKVLIIMLMVTSCVKSQNSSNLLTYDEYSNIRINNITLNSINLTKGNSQSLSELFNINFEYSETDFPDRYREIFSDDLEIEFTGNPSQSSYEISSIRILSSNVKVDILGKNIRLGNQIDLLGNFNVNNENSVIYEISQNSNQLFLSHKNFLLIIFDKTTREITSIELVVLT